MSARQHHGSDVELVVRLVAQASLLEATAAKLAQLGGLVETLAERVACLEMAVGLASDDDRTLARMVARGRA